MVITMQRQYGCDDENDYDDENDNDDDENDDDDDEADWTGPVEMCNGACSSKPGVSQTPTNLPSTSNQFLPHCATVINRQDDCDDDDDTDDDDNDDNDDCVSLTHTPSNQFLHHRIVINRLDYDDAANR